MTMTKMSVSGGDNSDNDQEDVPDLNLIIDFVRDIPNLTNIDIERELSLLSGILMSDHYEASSLPGTGTSDSKNKNSSPEPEPKGGSSGKDSPEEEASPFRIRSDLFTEDLDEQKKNLLEEMRRKVKIVKGGLCSALYKFSRVEKKSSASSVGLQFGVFRELRDVVLKSFYMLDSVDSKLKAEDVVKYNISNSLRSNQKEKSLALEELAEYFMKLLSLNFFIREPSFEEYKDMLLIMHFRISRLLNYFIIVAGKLERADINFMNIEMSIHDRLQKYYIPMEEIVSLWDHVRFLNLKTDVDEATIIVEHGVVGIIGFSKMIDTIVLRIRDQRQSSAGQDTPLLESGYSFERDMKILEDVTGRKISKPPFISYSVPSGTPIGVSRPRPMQNQVQSARGSGAGTTGTLIRPRLVLRNPRGNPPRALVVPRIYPGSGQRHLKPIRTASNSSTTTNLNPAQNPGTQTPMFPIPTIVQGGIVPNSFPGAPAGIPNVIRATNMYRGQGQGPLEQNQFVQRMPMYDQFPQQMVFNNLRPQGAGPSFYLNQPTFVTGENHGQIQQFRNLQYQIHPNQHQPQMYSGLSSGAQILQRVQSPPQRFLIQPQISQPSTSGNNNTTR